MDFATWSLFIVSLLFGCCVSAIMARKYHTKSGWALAYAALNVAFVLVVALMFVIGIAWETCANDFGLCTRSSDITVWNIILFPAFMFPIFFLIIILRANNKNSDDGHAT
jgi:hypothetical protein